MCAAKVSSFPEINPNKKAAVGQCISCGHVEFDVVNTARSVGTGNKITTLKGNDLLLKPGPDNNGDDESVLQNDHCDDCDTTLDDKKSMNHHLKRHQQLVTQSIGDLSEDELNGSVTSAEPIAEIRFAYDAIKGTKPLNIPR